MKRLTASLLLLLFFFTAGANTFVVTSNADSGPGTLREAITLANANGVSVNDTVVFAIANVTEAGRTISLQSELPPLSANIVVDGTTQAGATLGISNAKVVLYLDHFTSQPFVFLYINSAVNVKIYGLCFKFFDNPDAGGGGNYAVYLRNSSQITVGAPGKGNLFSAVRVGITNNFWNYYADSVRGLTVQGNVFGLNGINWPVRRGYIELIRASEITIGGPTTSEGNVFVGASINVSQAGATTGQFFTKIQNNKFNLDWTGSTYYQFEGGDITLYGSQTDDSSVTKTYVSDNVSSGSWPSGLTMVHVSHRAEVKGNKWQTDITGTICKGGYNEIKFIQCQNIVFGGYPDGERNITANTVYNVESRVNIIHSEFGDIFLNRLPKPDDPFIKILSYNGGLITGLANPNGKVQLYTNLCNTACINRKYLATVYANAAGQWSFTYAASMPNIVATATNSDSVTSIFSKPAANGQAVIIKHPTCGKANGSISGIRIVEGTHIEWRDTRTWQIISTDTNLVNVPAGDYAFLLYDGPNGCPLQMNYGLTDQSPPPSVTASVTPASCGRSDGSIYTNLYSSTLTLRWLNATNDSIGTNSSIANLFPGTYFLKAWVSGDTSCVKLYGPYIVTNSSGPTLNTANLRISPATCGNGNGSITGITASNVTGTPFTRWVDSLNNPVGNGYDLTNVPPGNYRLKFKDAGGCDTIITPFYTVGNNGNITLDTSHKIVLPAKCTGNTGSVQNIAVTGGNSYQWINTATGAVVGNTLVIGALPAGNYQLTVTNGFGCTKTSPVIVVPQTTFIPISVQAWGSGAANCGKPNGAIDAQTFSRDTGDYTFRWVDSAAPQVVLSTYTKLRGVYGGTYWLFAKDSNGCEQRIFQKAIGNLPVPSFDYSSLKVVSDECLTGRGAITNLAVKDLRGNAGTYVWLNANNDSVGNAVNLQNLSPGTYRLEATDLIGCTVVSQPVIVDNTNVIVTAPQCDDQTILINTAATLKVKNVQRGKYQLFADPLGASLLQENTTGNFTAPVLVADKVFYLRYVNGACASNPVPVKVTVVDKTAVYVPTGFTPNGDGKNDALHIVAYGRNKLYSFTVFNRWGEVVFSADNFNKQWNGTVNGTPAPAGVYVWMLKAVDELGDQAISQKGTVTLIR